MVDSRVAALDALLRAVKVHRTDAPQPRHQQHLRRLTGKAGAGDLMALTMELEAEEARERERDRLYWMPLRRELEALRRGKNG